ncbi:MAG: AAA family ATPase [Clostridia bacterium]|nr:AAA family ATPase [Clostridia bacterium]
MENNYWWLSINPKMLKFRELDVEDMFYYTALNEDGSKRTLHKNFEEIKKGEFVIAYEIEPSNEILGLCICVEELKNERILLKKVEGLTDTVTRYSMETHIELANLEVFRYMQGTLFKLARREFEVIYSMMRELNPKKKYQDYELYGKQSFLEEVYFDENDYDELHDLILARKNVVLQGAPGVGKTHIARRMAYSIIGSKDEEKVLNVQFHEMYSNDEFIEGYRPDDIGIYKYKRGCFKRICNKARNDPDGKYFVIIDEINRGNIPKIFGEAFSLIEIDKRGKENYIELSCSRERFYVPKNLYIIGTMNTFDEKLSLTDYALRRRFCFFTVIPVFENERFRQFYTQNPLLERIILKIMEINQTLDESMQIGHSYFCKPMPDNEIRMLVKYSIVPLIKEYYRKDPQKGKIIAKELLELL